VSIWGVLVTVSVPFGQHIGHMVKWSAGSIMQRIKRARTGKSCQHVAYIFDGGGFGHAMFAEPMLKLMAKKLV
jgi:hypothetical protein